jgi:hypothetical protein
LEDLAKQWSECALASDNVDESRSIACQGGAALAHKGSLAVAAALVGGAFLAA